jgi:uncharacterized membrane protein YgcG
VLAALLLAVIVPATQGSASTPADTIVNGCSQADPTAGCQGIVGALPATSSQVTVSGHGQFSNLQVTVNQTANLTNQAVSVSWTGGSPTFSDPASGAFDSTFNGNYLQIFQCWGDPQASDPPNAGSGPLPSQCEFGGESSSPSSAYPISNIGFEYSRVLSQNGWSTYPQLENAPGTYLDTTDNYVIEPFDAVDGTVVNQQADYGYDVDPFAPQPFWLNPYFSFSTTNEVDFARTYSNGTGQQLFTVDTGLEAPGLGCGQDIQPTAGGGTTTPQCWLVVVPRSTPTAEDPANVDHSSVVTSPLTPQAWANRIAIPLGFNSVGTSCSISAKAQEIIGGELAGPAVAAWQPSLCTLPGKTPFSYIENSDDQARQNLVNPSYGSVGMSVFTDPIPSKQIKKSNPVVYAPLTLSGVEVAFNIERDPITEPDGNPQPDELNLAGDRVANVYLTPLLVARLLTESYRDQLVDIAADTSPSYAWIQNHPTSVFTDPTFLQYNPEFSQLSTSYLNDAGTLLVEEGSSDATSALWKWVLSDPEAEAWLDGLPGKGADQGMNVNPYYSTNPAVNPSGTAFGTPTPESFPKSDPYCENTGLTVYGPPAAPARPLCVLDWSPYLLNMKTTALDAAAANDGAKTTFSPSQPPNLAWTANGPQITGNYFVMSVTDTASAARYGLQAASLSPAGEDTPNRTFVAPDAASLLAGEQAMVPSAVKGVLQSDPSSTAADAYPLTTLTYAATAPKTLDKTSRKNYSAFLRYAAGAGQIPGDQPGQLPAGYVPLPAALTTETLAAAATVLNPPTASSKPSKSSKGPGTDKGGSGSGSSGSYSSGSGGGSSSDYGSGPGSGSGSATAAAKHRSSRSPRAIGPSALSAVRTQWFAIGLMRWVLPFLLFVGLAAALGALWMNQARRRRLAGGPADTELGADPDSSEADPS